MDDDIQVKEIETNNLKGINIRIKKNSLNLLIGPSGSGKSSLAYDTIAQIGLHEYQSMFADEIYDANYKVSDYKNIPVTVPIKQTNNNCNVRSTIGTYFGINSRISTLFAFMTGKTEDFFVLNKEENTCKRCHGLGYIESLDPDKIIDYRKTISENPFRCWQRYGDFYTKILTKYCQEMGIDTQKTFDELSKTEREALLNGEGSITYQISYKHGKSRSTRSTKYYGILTGKAMRKNFSPANRFFSKLECPECKGAKYSSEHNKYKINGFSIGELMTSSFAIINSEIKEIIATSNDKRIDQLLCPVNKFIEKAIELNLGHLSLNRSIPSLSGGELQRLRLVQVFCTQLEGLMIILDEPLAGLSGIEKEMVYKNVMNLLPKHTLLIVDHSRKFIDVASRIIALGPGSGVNGGTIIDTNKYLDSQRIKYPKQTKREALYEKAELRGKVYHYNGAKIEFATKGMTLYVGQSGVGKTTLLKEYLPRLCKEYVYINQKPIMGNQNSSVATLLDIASPIFKLYANKYKKEKDFFSNSSGKVGACPNCGGAGYNTYGTLELKCAECAGTGFNPKSRKYKLGNASLFDIWKMTVDEAIVFFESIDGKIYKQLVVAHDIALGHLILGQPTSSLSGGEGIRIKMIDLIHSNADVVGVDEPFRGLNPAEVYQVAMYLKSINDRGKSIIVVDHTENISDYFDVCEEISVDKKNIIYSKKL